MNNDDSQLSVPQGQSADLVKRDARLSVSIPSTLALAMRNAWQPVPIPEPEVDSDLPNLPALQRSAEVLRYKILQLEHAVSPEGGLRGWLRLNVLLSLLIGIPALFLVPIITFLVSSFATWTGFILQAVLNILYTLLGLLAIGAIIMIVGFVLTQLRRQQIRNAQQGGAGNGARRRA